MAQESPIQSWNLTGPWVVSAVKSGAVSPSLSDIASPHSSAVEVSSSSRLSGGDRRVRAAAPFGPRAVVHRRVAPAEAVEPQGPHPRAHPRAAAPHHRPGGGDPRAGQGRPPVLRGPPHRALRPAPPHVT